MAKHIVLFKLRDDVSVERKLVVMNSFKEAIEALPAEIFVVRKIEVGLSTNPEGTWNTALYSEFDNLDDVKFYTTYSEHVAIGKVLAETKKNWACVDYGF